MNERDNDYMAKRPLDLITAEAWNSLVDLVLRLDVRVALLEQQVNDE